MADDTPCLIVDCTDSPEWSGRLGELNAYVHSCPQRLPDDKRPTILQPSRAVAEAEALRLAAAHPDRRFVVFEAAAAAITTTVPTHTTINGAPWGERRVAVLLDLGADDGVPF